MVKRPPFEEANYPPPVENRTAAQWILFGIIIAAVAVVVIFGYNYWWSCEDWGWLKFCGSIRKP